MNDRNDEYGDEYEDDVTEYDTDEDELERNPTEQGKWLSLGIALLGAWLIVSPWLFGTSFTETVGINSVASGVLLAVLGGYNFYRRADKHIASIPVAVLCAVIGLWLLISPMAFEIGLDDLAGWNYIVVGLLAAGLGLYSSYEVRSQDADAAVVE